MEAHYIGTWQMRQVNKQTDDNDEDGCNSVLEVLLHWVRCSRDAL